ncbi:MAG: DUF4132 domain-containing protein [Nibricoccus sp.]
MFNQLKNVIGKMLGASEENLIESTFGPVVEADRSLPRDIAKYVVTGQPANVLNRIATIPEVGGRVGILCGYTWSMDGPKFDAHRKLIASLGEWEPAGLLRLAEVYFAASKSPAKGPVRGYTMKTWQGGYEWLELFLRQITHSPLGSWSAAPKPTPPVTLSAVEAMISRNQQDPTMLARGAVVLDTSAWGWNVLTQVFRSFSDFKDMLERQAAVVREGFNHSDFKVKVHALETLAFARVDPLIWRDEIAEFMVGSSKTVRQAAEPLVRMKAAEFRGLLERHAKEGDNETRANAVQACHRIYGEEARRFLEECRSAEKAKKVVEILDDILRIPEPSASKNGEIDNWDLPPVAPVNKQAPLSGNFRQDLTACLEKAYGEGLAAYERVKHQKWAGKFDIVVSENLIASVLKELEEGGATESRRARIPAWREWRDGSNRILDFAGHPQFQLIHLVRWCTLWAEKPGQHYWFHWCGRAFSAYAKTHGRSALRDVAAAFEAAGYDPGTIGKAYLTQWHVNRVPLFQQPPEGIWPFFAERLQLLEEALGVVVTAPSSNDYMSRFWEKYERQNALTALSYFPRAPKRMLPLMWEIALTGAKAERQSAQNALSREPDTIARLIANLGNGQMEVRAEAAGWLARLGAKEAKAPMLAALKKEKKEVAQSALMLALEAFGVPIAELVDREALEKEALKQASKPTPSDLEWFPFATMPALRWLDNGVVVPGDLIKYLILQAFKVKNPEPGPLLRTYAGFFAVQDRAKLGRFIVEAWIAQDTIPAHTSDEAAKLAEAQTQQMAQYYKQNPQYAASWDEQKHYRSVYNHLLGVCKGSAIGSKGILAVAGACADGTVAPVIHRYIKEYYGMRGAQAKALLQMLAWIDDPNAIQVLLAIGNRFRTKGIQEEATRLCQELADRKSWTLDELADRTIPTAGLDEEGVLELDFGARSFKASLTADLTLTLTNAEGREISSLPEPNKADNEEKAKTAKQALSSARKDLKTILKLQQERLYEAMCTQREWVFGDFRRYILEHPIVGRICERLVWSVVEDGKTTVTFRPLADKTLTNTDDDAVSVGTDARIRLAHDAAIAAAQRDAWLAHFTDYKIEPLFQQFGKLAYTVPEAQREETEINEYRGHIVENFKLRGRLTTLGYTRGQAQDGGWFSEYHKRFPGLGIQATINFSGSPLPEENRPVALLSLCFSSIGGDGAGVQFEANATRLCDLPAVLVSECWNDLRLAASDGKGFDPNWEKTVQY